MRKLTEQITMGIDCLAKNSASNRLYEEYVYSSSRTKVRIRSKSTHSISYGTNNVAHTQPQTTNYHIITRKNLHNQIPGNSDILCEMQRNDRIALFHGQMLKFRTPHSDAISQNLLDHGVILQNSR